VEQFSSPRIPAPGVDETTRKAKLAVNCSLHRRPLALSVQTATVSAVTPDHPETPQYHLLPKDNVEAAVDIMRVAAGLPPLYGEPDDEDG
jgi:hypothetical protein